MQRPSETITAAVGSILGAVVAILVGYGVHIPDGVEAAAVVLVGWVATVVTTIVARRQRTGSVASGHDGKVLSH